MVLNGSEFMRDPISTMFKPYTDFFMRVTGNGGLFYVFVILVFAVAIQIKFKNITFTSMFIIGSSGILSLSTFMVGSVELGVLFTIFTAIGILMLVIGVIFQFKK